MECQLLNSVKTSLRMLGSCCFRQPCMGVIRVGNWHRSGQDLNWLAISIALYVYCDSDLVGVHFVLVFDLFHGLQFPDGISKKEL